MEPPPQPPPHPHGDAVRVRGARKRFGQASVLRGLDMTVQEGTIYGLLGPSGCGKTTLLRCLLGRTQLDSGDIRVKAQHLNNVGYMPQELALYQDMTIAETFNFYGRIFGMEWGRIEERGLDLLKFLNLPDSDSFIGQLSGGQMRRVSFAIALLHDPQLLILDEPTAGVDPVLSFTIWERLLRMAVHQKKTIIITTHYIEEARQAHTIGLMRHGVLLAEESPQQLMQHQNCSNLEQAFLSLSQAQHERLQADPQLEDDVVPVANYSSLRPPPSPPLKQREVWNNQRFLAQLIKNFVWNMRNIPMLLFVLLLPALQAFLCNMILGSEPHNMYLGILSGELPGGIADCDSASMAFNCSAGSGHRLTCAYVRSLRDKQLKLKGKRIDLEDLTHMRMDGSLKRYKEICNNGATQRDYGDVESAHRSVLKGESWGYLVFPANYTSSLLKRLEEGPAADEVTVDRSLIDVWLDMSNLWVSSMIKRDIVLSLVDYLRNVLISCQFSPELADIPLKFERPVYGLTIPKFIHFCAPGVIISFCFYLPIMFTTGAIMMEKEAGLLERSLISGMSILEVVVAHTLLQVLLVGAQNAVIFICFYVVYYNPLYGSVYLLLTLVYLVEIMGIAYAFMLAVLFDSEKLATYAGVGTIVLMFIICGVVWPYQGMHWLVRWFVEYSPLQPAVEAYRGIAERGWGVEAPVVRYGFTVSLVWLAFFTTAAYVIARRKKFVT